MFTYFIKIYHDVKNCIVVELRRLMEKRAHHARDVLILYQSFLQS